LRKRTICDADHEPEFTDREKINLEIYAERKTDEAMRERYLEFSRGQDYDYELSESRGR
jgi:hypothetical protein